jgi:hypothetical protein
MEPTAEQIAQAKLAPNSWVFAIDGNYDLPDRVPAHAIKGAWAVDDHGNIFGEFLPNPNYDPSSLDE